MRLSQKLNEQLGFLRRSCQAYDTGSEDEALRIAASLRVIFHDTKQSTSLIRHLNIPDQMLSSSRGHRDYKDYVKYKLDLRSPTPVAALPVLGSRFHKVSLNRWWRHEPVFVHKNTSYTRNRIVLSAANKDGGAHVDAKLEEFYEFLVAGEFALGVTGDLKYHGPPPFEQGVTQYARNVHLALLRQFGHEVLASAKQFDWTAASGGREISSFLRPNSS